MELIAGEGVLDSTDALRAPYRYYPVEVPPGATGLRVALHYADRGPTTRRGIGNILDLGLIEPGPLHDGGIAFRGWSGSERTEIVIGERMSTPGYRAGPIPSGTWHVILGLCQVAEGGCLYRIEAHPLDRDDARLGDPERAPDPERAGDAERAGDTERGDDPERPGDPEREPRPVVAGGDRWWPGDLHCHTVHSDGKLTVGEIARFARVAGLAFLFVSDHNTDSHHAGLEAAGAVADIALYPAEEVTTYRGHMGALGIPGWVDFRHRADDEIAAAAAAVRAAGGFTIRNHPGSNSSPWAFGLPATDAIEVWNGPWRTRNRNDRALDLWAAECATGRRTVAVGGSDMHDVAAERQPIGSPVTWVRASRPGRVEILAGLRAGRVIVTRGVHGPHVELSARVGAGSAGIGDVLRRPAGIPVEVAWRVRGAPGAEVRILSEAGLLAAERLDRDDAAGTLELPPDRSARLVRLEVRDRDGAPLVLTNPVHLQEEP